MRDVIVWAQWIWAQGILRLIACRYLQQRADGINMGTRFCATKEAPIHDNIKAKYVENDERGTNLIFRNFKNTARVGKSDVSDEVVRRLALPDAKFEDVASLVSGAAGAELLRTGDLEGGMF